jgi:hypothetical protein
MSKEQNLDRKISRLVRAVDLDIPPELERKIREQVPELTGVSGRKVFSRPFWITAAGSAAALLLLAFLIFPPKSRHPIEPVVAEIRTEFEIPDKNITIIFIQKSDFPRLKEI